MPFGRATEGKIDTGGQSNLRRDCLPGMGDIACNIAARRIDRYHLTPLATFVNDGRSPVFQSQGRDIRQADPAAARPDQHVTDGFGIPPQFRRKGDDDVCCPVGLIDLRGEMPLKRHFDRIIRVPGADAAHGHACRIKPDPQDGGACRCLDSHVRRPGNLLDCDRNLFCHAVKHVQIAAVNADRDSGGFAGEGFANPITQKCQSLALHGRIAVKDRADLLLRCILACAIDILEANMKFATVGPECVFSGLGPANLLLDCGDLRNGKQVPRNARAG